ncbi:hypothetical protein Tco_0895981 [Tanacetum coccineum]|uniref:Uncharacterized protein n=1 Tax=Tanacetum coccineum TaxID=301880 RepID=A0ABQ5CHB7_9ASTR
MIADIEEWHHRPKHQSDTKVFTMMMEILLEPTSNKILVAFDAGLVVTESNETRIRKGQCFHSRSRKDTHAEDSDINSVNDKQPMAEAQLTVEHNLLANQQQHYEQYESIYDTYLLEKVDINTTLDSTDMSHRG